MNKEINYLDSRSSKEREEDSKVEATTKVWVKKGYGPKRDWLFIGKKLAQWAKDKKLRNK